MKSLLLRRCWPLACLLVLSACVTQSQSFWATDRLSDLRKALANSDYDHAETLVERYSGTLSPDLALDLSIREGNVNGVKHFLLSSRINAPLDPDGVTPLIRAVQESPDDTQEKIVRLLLSAGADPSLTDNFGRSATNYANFGGNPALAAFLESGGTSYYSSQPAQQTAWLPKMNIDNVLDGASSKRSKKRRSRNPLLSRSPLIMSKGGRPDLLFASAWIPTLDPNRYGPYAGLRFHADGTGEVMRFYPQDKRMEARDESHLAWDFHRDSLYFMVLTERYAAYCHSVLGAPGKFGVSCVDYAAAGGNIAAALNIDLSDASAKTLLNDASARALLEEVGKTTSVLEPADSKVCKPRIASKKARSGAPVKAAHAKKFGDWVLFDSKRFTTYSTENELACTQRGARKAAFDLCKASGGNCRSVGGCRGQDATAVASVQGHGWAWMSCNKSPELAKAQALAQCRARSGCDCQVVYTSNLPRKKPPVCSRG